MKALVMAVGCVLMAACAVAPILAVCLWGGAQ